MSDTSIKGFVPTILLCFFFGVFGVHRFYVGKVGTGILQLLTLGGFGIWTLVDFIMIVVGSFKTGELTRPQSIEFSGASIVLENLLNPQPEQARSFEGERQAGVEFPLLDRIDRLPGNLQLLGQLRLGPVALGTQYLQAILHWYFLRPRSTPTR